MTTFRLHLLGPPHLESDGVEVHIGRRKAVALLAYLAVTGRAHTRDALAAPPITQDPDERSLPTRILVVTIVGAIILIGIASAIIRQRGRGRATL